MTTYSIATTDKAPSMSQTRQTIQVATYAEAVELAQKSWKATKRYTALFSGEYGMDCWHSINNSGIATDRNFNSGIPETAQL